MGDFQGLCLFTRGYTQRRNAAFWFERPDALTPSSTTSTAMTPTKLDQPMPTSIKGQAWLQRSSRWKGKPFRGNREVSWRISQPFLLCNKKQKKKRGRSSTRFNGLHQQTFEERSHRSYITGTIMKAFQRLQVLNRWVGYQEASMYVCMHACMYLSIYVSMYLCIYVSIYVSMYLCVYIYVCATGINYVIYVICVQHVYIIYIC